jgi:hypothetical protein
MTYTKMKDEEFQKKLELILEEFERIDRTIEEYLQKKRHTTKTGYLNTSPLSTEDTSYCQYER